MKIKKKVTVTLSSDNEVSRENLQQIKKQLKEAEKRAGKMNVDKKDTEKMVKSQGNQSPNEKVEKAEKNDVL